MTDLEIAQNEFLRTRVEAIAAYKLYKQQSKGIFDTDDYYRFRDYRKAWQAHEEASYILFLLEVNL